MDGEALREIRRACERLRDLAEAFPDFHYLELTGPALADERLTRAAMTVIAAGARCHYDYRPEDLTALGVYGRGLDAAVESLCVVADEVWLTVRRVQRTFHFGDGPALDDMPAAREWGAPFILLNVLVHMAIDFPIAMAEEVTKLAGRPWTPGPGGMTIYEGAIEVEGACLVLPGDTVVMPPSCDDRDYARVVAAAERGELSVLYSLSPAFALLSAFFDSCLTLSGAAPESAVTPSSGGEIEQVAASPTRELIPPNEQATMLGWAEPNSVSTLKRVAALRRAVLARGMTLDEQRKPGMGNKTFVPREQWEDVVTLFRLVAPTAPNADKAIAALAGGVRLMNTTGLPVSYRCDYCGKVTRNSAPEPQCEGCGRHDRLRPLTTPRGNS